MNKVIKEVKSRAISEKDKKDFAKYEPMFDKPVTPSNSRVALNADLGKKK